MVTTSNIAEIGSLLGDPARVNMLVALLDGRARSARELADAAGVTPQTASSHLAKLIDGGLLTALAQGRHRYHRIASHEVAQLLEQMHVVGAAIPGRMRTPGPVDRAMRHLRSCYDHLAGEVAVAVTSAVLAPTDAASSDVQLSVSGEQRLQEIGMDLELLRKGRRQFCSTCLDWSERRPHVAGAVGGGILARFEQLAWIRRRAGSRALLITGVGQAGLSQVFDVRAELGT